MEKKESSSNSRGKLFIITYIAMEKYEAHNE